MAEICCNHISCHTSGDVISVGDKAPEFVLTASNLSLVSLNDYAGQALLLNVFVSIDTPICIDSCKRLNEMSNGELNILSVSMDLPFALARLEEEQRFPHIKLLSDFRTRSFGDAYNLTIIDGPLAGLLARDIIVLDKSHHIVYQDLSHEVTEPPKIELAIEALQDSQ